MQNLHSILWFGWCEYYDDDDFNDNHNYSQIRILRQQTFVITCMIIFFVLVSSSSSKISLAYQDQIQSDMIMNKTMYGNMSSMMMMMSQSGQATPMTNGSLMALGPSSASSSNQTTSSSTMSSNNNKMMPPVSHNTSNNIMLAQTKSASHQQQASSSVKGISNGSMVSRAAPTNSPAVNSRLKQQQQNNSVAGQQQQQQNRQQYDSMGTGGSGSGRRGENQMQMDADDTHDMQAFMTINSNPTSVSDSTTSGGNASSSRDKLTSTSRQNEKNEAQTTNNNNSGATANNRGGSMDAASTAKQSSGSSGITSTSPINKASSGQQQSKFSSPGRQQSGLWVTGSPHGYNTSPEQQQQQQWRSRSSGAKQMPSQQNSLEQLSQQRYLESSLLSPPSLESDSSPVLHGQPPIGSSQLEKPNGYSYEGGSYTHTSPLSPARQELMTAEQVSLKQRHRQQQNQYHQSAVVGPQHYERQGHSTTLTSAASDWMAPRSTSGPSELGQFTPTIAGKSTINQLPHIIQQQQQLEYGNPTGATSATTSIYGRQGGNLQSPAAHHHHLSAPPSGGHQHHAQPFSMMPSPHLTITGTPNNPCKPPIGLQTNEPSGIINQINLPIPSTSSNEIIGQATAQALPNFSNQANTNKYQRVGDGTRLRSQFIFKVIRADSLTECELACSKASSVAGNNPQEACRSFNYRAYFAAENCELSRHDLRALKLEDGAQFEQHTQFDFYALEPTTAAAAGSSAALSASASSLVNSVAAYSPFPEADCLDVTQSCSQDGMEFTLRTNEPFNGRIYTYGFYDSCFYDGEGSSTNVLRISRSNGFPRCGTQQFGDLMTNIVVVQFNDYVQTTRDKKYNLTCYFSGPGEAVVTSNYLDTRIDERSHPMQIEHLPPQNVITSNVHLRVLYRGQPTNTIAVGDLLTFRLETRNIQQQQHRANTEAGQSEIFATNVLAKDPYSGRQVQLIDSRGCPIDPVNVFPELQRTPDGALESEFYAFKIPDSNFLIFQATVRTCKAPCEPVICHTPGSHGGSSDQTQRGQYMVSPSGAGGGGGTKGGYLMQSPLIGHHSAYLQQHSSVPSWGKRRRRRRRRETANDGEDGEEGGDFVSVGETVEHVIPVRFAQVGRDSVQRHRQEAEVISSGGKPREIKTYRRPELSEAEEEVKEMFRVYMSRAEINKQQRHHHHLDSDKTPLLVHNHQFDTTTTTRQDPLGTAASSQHHQSSPLTDNTASANIQEQPTSDSGDQICMAQANYYVMLFTVISLSLVMFSVLFVSLYITRKAKFHISDSIADSIF